MAPCAPRAQLAPPAGGELDWVPATGLMTLTGVWLRWRSHSHYADIEEEMKNGKIAAEEAQRRFRTVDRRAAALIFLGIGLLVVAVAALLG